MAEAKTVWGYAVLWGSVTNIANEFLEKFAKGSLTRSIAEDDVRMLLDHDSGRVVGRTAAGTLRLREDALGLRYECDVNLDTPDGQTLAGTVGRRDVSGISPSFVVRAESWDDSGSGLPLRTITDARLIELSAVAWPAYPQTTAAMRSTANTNNQAAKRRIEAKQRARGII
ncbi:HK97 family phage prohead protease [Bradyrhizobium symbiodeficiens]|uniref:HK97 family phage prohead protease n=1 Tax=Bradyrhizobium symbiodeficiens TaxID=1404367 RepID=UPI0030D1BA46